MENRDFERFYYNKVALGEGCGCAEQIITARDIEARTDVNPRPASVRGLFAAIFTRWRADRGSGSCR